MNKLFKETRTAFWMFLNSLRALIMCAISTLWSDVKQAWKECIYDVKRGTVVVLVMVVLLVAWLIKLLTKKTLIE